jgi:hypothetical protein
LHYVLLGAEDQQVTASYGPIPYWQDTLCVPFGGVLFLKPALNLAALHLI